MNDLFDEVRSALYSAWSRKWLALGVAWAVCLAGWLFVASIPYRANMTVLDAMIAVGGLSEFAAGNKAKLIRFDPRIGRQREYALRLTDLLKRGDSKANVLLQPGDVIIIPESTF